MSDPELKELFRKLRDALHVATLFDLDSVLGCDRAKHVFAITEAESLAENIYRELEVRESESVIRNAA